MALSKDQQKPESPSPSPSPSPGNNLESDLTQPSGTQTPASDPVPSNHQLLEAILPIRSSAPTLGVPKLLNRLKELNPNWQLSEKRLRKFLNLNPNLSPQAARHQVRLTPRPPCEPMWIPDYSWEKDWEAASAENSSTEPSSSLDDTILLECRQRSVKVEPVRFPANNKGSGLISKDYMPRGTQIIKEDAFVWVPPTKNLSRSVISGQNCAFCGRSFSMQRTKNQPHCPHHPAPGSKEAIASQQLVATTSTSMTTGSQSVTERPAGPEPCYMRYCTRVCAQKSVEFYGPLVCPQKNPEYMQLIRYSDSEEFRAAHMVFKLFARMLISNESGEISQDPCFELQDTKDQSSGHTSEQALKAVANRVEVREPEAEVTGTEEPVTNGTKKSKRSKAKKKVGINSSIPEAIGTSVEFEKIFKRIQGLATISDRARREKFSGNGHLGSHFTDARYGQMWRSGWHTVIKALHLDTGYRPRPSTNNNHLLSSSTSSTDTFWESFWKRRLKPEIIANYFGLRSFLEFIGKTALNREADHGLYLLHSRFNHSCEPNAMVLKHPGSEEIHKSSPSTIYVISKKEISKDEEITLSYVNPDLPLETRRKKLFEDYLFSCFCSRCRRELQEEEQRQLSENQQQQQRTKLYSTLNGRELVQQIISSNNSENNSNSNNEASNGVNNDDSSSNTNIHNLDGENEVEESKKCEVIEEGDESKDLQDGSKSSCDRNCEAVGKNQEGFCENEERRKVGS
ncbi:hypothetical protein BY996DRAFT_4579807 [Phakopsora pachyrhizi]|uniref:Histone-lysine N-methyltransferase SET5 n=1 Tax=Phakopsora pachyrhizi TaxID=170000 RepID=A0AAV0AJF8_PHAPC|nr:hypothetical protein BY996DRAFT_4579807 [Phakopsora pachyrhizi]CAH7668121.1 hypothetical protein PPACK8108_LOCUS2598 [Phakopsora pachyrhizi]